MNEKLIKRMFSDDEGLSPVELAIAGGVKVLTLDERMARARAAKMAMLVEQSAIKLASIGELSDMADDE